MADFLTRLAERTLRAETAMPIAQPVLASMFAPEAAIAGSLPEVEAWTTRGETQASIPAKSPPQPVERGQQFEPGFGEGNRRFRRGEGGEDEERGLLRSPVVGIDDVPGNATRLSERQPTDNPLSGKHVDEATFVRVGEGEDADVGRRPLWPPARDTLTLAPLENAPGREGGERGDQPLVPEVLGSQPGSTASTDPEDFEEKHIHTAVQQSITATSEDIEMPHAEKTYKRQAGRSPLTTHTGEGSPVPVIRQDIPVTGEHTDRLLVTEAESRHTEGLAPEVDSDQRHSYTVVPHDIVVGREGSGLSLLEEVSSDRQSTNRGNDPVPGQKMIQPVLSSIQLPRDTGAGYVPHLQPQPDQGTLNFEEQVLPFELDDAKRGTESASGSHFQLEISSIAPRMAPSQVEPVVRYTMAQVRTQQGESGSNASSSLPVEPHVLLTYVPPAQNPSYPQSAEQRLLVPQGQSQQGTIHPEQTEPAFIDTASGASSSRRDISRSNPSEAMLGESRPTMPAEAALAATPTIHVTIGRIDVRAITPPAPPPQAKPGRRGPALSLDEYLKQGKGGGR
jgi:hypothetical protein